MTDQAQRNPIIERRARHALVIARLRQRWQRLGFFVAVLVLSLVYVPAGWVGGCIAAMLAAELLERRAAAGFLAARPARARRAWLGFVVANLVTASAIGLIIVVLWVFATPDEQLFPLGLLFINTFYVALANPQVLWLLMARQGLYAVLATALALRDMLLGETLFATDFITGLLPILGFSVCVVALSRWAARAYRRRLEHTHALAEARDEAERERRAKSTLIATISHELRTPLNGIIGMAQALLGAELEPAVRRRIEVIAESGHNLNALLNEILDFSKLEAGELAIASTEDDLRRTAEHVESLFRPLAEQAGLDFTVEVGEAVPQRLVFDTVRVRQCLSNLVSNALKFTERGSVRVALTAAPVGPEHGAPGDAQRWRITATVTDTGIGIDEAQQCRLFAPFIQGDGSISRRYGGTGLGLNITRRLAKAMGGGVSVESVPGEGSTFRFEFLAETPARRCERGQTGDTAGTPALAGRVLVADEAETNRMVLRLLLEALGVEAVEARDGPAALAALEHDALDAALVDLKLPGIDAAELAARVRRGELGRPDLALVAVSGAHGADEAGQTEDFDAFLAKPINPAALRTVLERVLGGRSVAPAAPKRRSAVESR